METPTTVSAKLDQIRAILSREFNADSHENSGIRNRKAVTNG